MIESEFQGAIYTIKSNILSVQKSNPILDKLLNLPKVSTFDYTIVSKGELALWNVSRFHY